MKSINFPTTVIDDFFDYPEEVRELALSQKYGVGDDTRWPGKRTKPLHEISPVFFDIFCNRIFNIFYDLRVHSLNWTLNAYFQSIESSYDTGWVHQDMSIISGLVYLSKGGINSGTTLYRPIDPITTKFINEDEKNLSYRDVAAIKDFDKYKQQNNNQFRPSISIEEEFNRLVLFDGHMFHGSDKSYGNSLDNSRLTLVFFLKQLSFNNEQMFPIPRLKTYY